MHSDVLTIGDLFEEDNFSWVNDEEAMAFSKIEELIYQFKIDYGRDLQLFMLVILKNYKAICCGLLNLMAWLL